MYSLPHFDGVPETVVKKAEAIGIERWVENHIVQINSEQLLGIQACIVVPNSGRTYSRSNGDGSPQISLAQAESAAKRNGIDTRQFKLEFEEGPNFGFMSQRGDGSVFRARIFGFTRKAVNTTWYLHTMLPKSMLMLT